MEPMSSNAMTPIEAPPTTSTPTATDANSRSLKHLSIPRWMAFVGTCAAIRTMIFHPLNVVLTRKRVNRDDLPLRDAFRAILGESVAQRRSSTWFGSSSAAVRMVYRGFGVAVTGTIMGECAYVMTLEGVKQWVGAKVVGDAAAAPTVTSGVAAAAMNVNSVEVPRCDGGGDDTTTQCCFPDGGLHMVPMEHSSSSSHPPPSFSGFAQASAQVAAPPPSTSWLVLRDAASGAMADLVPLLFLPFNVVCNRQMTAGTGMVADVPYQSAWKTMCSVIYGHQHDCKFRPFTGCTHGNHSAYCTGTHSSAASAASPLPSAATSSTAVGASAVPSGSSSAAAVAAEKQIHAPRGIKGLFSGFGASLFFVPAGALWWSVHGGTKRLAYAAAQSFQGPAPPPSPTTSGNASTMPIASTGNNNSSAVPPSSMLTSTTDNPLINGLAGVIASSVTALTFNPLSVLKMRVQVLDMDKRSTAAPTTVVPPGAAGGANASAAVTSKPSYVRVAVDLWRHEGWRGLFKGAGLGASMAAMEGLVFSVLFEYGKYWSDVTAPV